MALTACENPPVAVTAEAVKNTPWQSRLKAAGLTQKRLAELLGVAENTISRQMKGEWEVPGYVEAFVVAWELAPADLQDAIAERLTRTPRQAK